MKKALIFGVSGQDGAYLAKLMLSKGYTVYGTSRDAQVSTFRNLKYLGIREQVQLESAALNDFRSVLQVLKKTQPDEVYNLAGQTSVGLSFEQPVETLESIAVGSRLSFIMRLSSEVFGDINGAAADESTPFSLA
jgi:GDPmannose 4,6-dehydratase